MGDAVELHRGRKNFFFLFRFFLSPAPNWTKSSSSPSSLKLSKLWMRRHVRLKVECIALLDFQVSKICQGLTLLLVPTVRIKNGRMSVDTGISHATSACIQSENQSHKRTRPTQRRSGKNTPTTAIENSIHSAIDFSPPPP